MSQIAAFWKNKKMEKREKKLNLAGGIMLERKEKI